MNKNARGATVAARRPILAGVTITLVILIGGWFALLLSRGGAFVDTAPLGTEGCRAVSGFLGPEDIAVDPVRQRAFVTNADRFGVFVRHQSPNGHIAILTAAAGRLEMRAPASLPPARFFPHGLDFLDTEDGGRLFVVDHGADGHTHAIRILRPEKNGDLALTASHSGSALIDPNDVAAVDEERFYVTNLYGSRSALGRFLENYLFLPRANVLFFDGTRFRVVARGLMLANGIVYDRARERLFIAEVLGRRVRVYRVNPFSHDLIEERRIALPFGPDNLALGKDGTLWAAGHPNLLATARMMGDLSKPAPSAVARITNPASKEPQVTLVFRDPGTRLAAASIAVPFAGRLLIGAVFGDHLLSCPLPQG